MACLDPLVCPALLVKMVPLVTQVQQDHPALLVPKDDLVWLAALEWPVLRVLLV